MTEKTQRVDWVLRKEPIHMEGGLEELLKSALALELNGHDTSVDMDTVSNTITLKVTVVEGFPAPRSNP